MTRRTQAEVAVRALLVLVTCTWLPQVFTVDARWYRWEARHLSLTSLPYRGLPWEFPPLTTPVLVVARVLSEDVFTVVFAAAMLATELGALELLRRAHPELEPGLTRAWHVLVLPMVPLVAFRLDALPTLALAGALAAAHLGRPTARWVVAGAALKLWPALVLLLHVPARRWSDLRAGVAGLAALLAGWWLWSPSGFAQFLAYRRGSGLQIESIPASLVRPFTGGPVVLVSGAAVHGAGGWGWVEPLAMVALLVGSGLLLRTAWTRPGHDPVALVGARVLLSMLCSRILSPQYLVWIAPAVVLLAARGRRGPLRLALAAEALTLLVVVRYDQLVDGSIADQVVLLVRNALLVGLLLSLVRAACGVAAVDGPVEDAGVAVGGADPCTLR
jgi:hypothetical protein